MRQIFLDTETTGLSPDNGDRVVELACVELVNRKPSVQHRHYYLNPGRESHPDALRIHGLTTEFLRDKPPFAQVVEDWLAFIDGAELLIHNAPFDVGFLNKELSLLGLPTLENRVARVVDTLGMAKSMFPGKRNSLDALCDRFGVDRSTRTLHGALLDARLLSEVYLHMTRGQNALAMEVEVESGRQDAVPVDLRTLDLPVPRASEQELAEHESLLAQIDKASGGKTIWRALA